MTMTASSSTPTGGHDDLVASQADCRVDQNKGLISIVENKLAACGCGVRADGRAGGSFRAEQAEEPGEGQARTGHRLQYGAWLMPQHSARRSLRATAVPPSRDVSRVAGGG